MTADTKILQIISNETKDSINQMNVVTPSVYASIFTNFSKEHDAEIEDDSDLANDILTQECSTLTQMQESTSQNVMHLSEHTEKAITAIQEKDETALSAVLEETQKLKAELEKLKEAVYLDELTHIHNRKWLNDQKLENGTTLFKEDGVLAMIDLNYFKLINDTHGHLIGDKILMFLSNELKKTGFDVIRFGGDEFIVLFPKNISAKHAFETLSKLRETILKKKFKSKTTLFKVSFSIGVSEYTTKDELASAIELADKHMYEDKLSIKKRVTGIDIE